MVCCQINTLAHCLSERKLSFPFNLTCIAPPTTSLTLQQARQLLMKLMGSRIADIMQ